MVKRSLFSILNVYSRDRDLDGRIRLDLFTVFVIYGDIVDNNVHDLFIFPDHLLDSRLCSGRRHNANDHLAALRERTLRCFYSYLGTV